MANAVMNYCRTTSRLRQSTALGTDSAPVQDFPRNEFTPTYLDDRDHPDLLSSGVTTLVGK